MTGFRRALTIAIALFSLLWVPACNEFEDPPPPSPTSPVIPPTQFAIDGRWDGVTDQGRPVRFDVRNGAVIAAGRVGIHHDCSGGRLVLQLQGYQSVVDGDTFTVTMNWRRDDPDFKFYVGTLTISGRFEGDRSARGGFVNSITDKQADNLGVCPPSSGSWEASKSE